MSKADMFGRDEHRSGRFTRKSIGMASILLAAALFVPGAEASTVTLYPVADNWINSCASGSGANHGGDLEVWVRTATLWGDVKNNRTLLMFDLSALPVDGERITESHLGLYFNDYHWDNPEGRVYSVHRLTRLWEEMGSNWEVRSGLGTGTPIYWDSYLAGTPSYRPGGGDFDPYESASAVVPEVGGWMVWDVTDLVRLWVDEDQPNRGLLIKDASEFEAYSGDDVAWGPAQFTSGDSWNQDYWPYLEVVFDLPGDYDEDGDVGLEDFAHWDDCMTGPEGGPCDVDCVPFDFNDDTDVDLQDFTSFMEVFSAPR